MTFIYIQQGISSQWWNSPAIWVTAQGDPSTGPKVASPVVGKPYTVWVEVQNPFLQEYNGGWNLFVCWGIPFTGTMATVTSEQILNGNMSSGGSPQGLPIAVGSIPAATPTSLGTAALQAATTWIPSLENGGHECLLAALYNEQFIATVGTSVLLDGDLRWNYALDITVAQHNLTVVQSTGGMRHLPPYHFQVWNSSNEARDFEVAAWQAPLSGIEPFLSGIKGGRAAVFDSLGKVEHLGLVAGAKTDQAQLEKAPDRMRVRIPPRSSHPFTLGIGLSKGNALINVAQSLDGRIVGGLSVLAMAEAK